MGREQFDNTVKAEWIEGEERLMRLLETVKFTDSEGRVWTALEGSIIDGASIPEFLWDDVGPPFIGHYRRASVIHDVYCQNHLRLAQDVHNCFNEMMLADGVSYMKAWAMFTGVDKFGPRW